MGNLPGLDILLFAEATFFVAYAVFGMVGFGTTLVAAPILAHVIPVPTLVPVQALLDAVGAAGNGWRLSAQVAWREVLRLLPAMFAGCVFGAYSLFAVPLKTLMLLLGALVILYALNGLRPKAPRPTLSSAWSWWYGATGGVLSALFGAGAWVYAIYLARRLEDPAAVRATQMVVVTASAFIRVGLFLLAGAYANLSVLALAAALIPAMVLGIYLGGRVTLKMERARFMQMLYAILLLTGGSLVVRGLA